MTSENKSQPGNEAQLVLRMPMEKKNAWVKASKKEGQKVGEWAQERVDGTLHGGTNPPRYDDSALPRRLRDNWHIYTSVRSAAQVAHARQFANTTVGFDPSAALQSDAWQAAFDRAALDWLAENPTDPRWSQPAWPNGAEKYLGSDAHDEAIRLMGLA